MDTSSGAGSRAQPPSAPDGPGDRSTGDGETAAWGPYLSDRQWGTVREDYSATGSAWSFFPHDHARSRAYRWGEDGIGGFCDREQRLCIAVAFWNERDPIIKERLFGLTNEEANHGEDVKELYFYLDGSPDHAYQRMRYLYPRAAYPYEALVRGGRDRGPHDPELEITDAADLDRDGYFDIEIEYVAAGPDDLLLRVTATNRSGSAAPLHILPHVWFRNTWDWSPGAARPGIERVSERGVRLAHEDLGERRAWCDVATQVLICENRTNEARLWGAPHQPGVKDGINDAVVHGRRDGLSPGDTGTKSAFWCRSQVPTGGSVSARVRLAREDIQDPFADFDRLFNGGRRAAERRTLDAHAPAVPEEHRRVQRQAWAGLTWSKQYYAFDVPLWLNGDPGQPAPPPQRRRGRNSAWTHLNNADVHLMPDKWEYPWYAAWDSAFHAVAYARIDPAFAKSQLVLLMREWYMHPSGQLPAYEWALGDVNPPVHAWAAWRVFEIDRERGGGRGDHAFLERVFHKLLLNFTWWVNRKDADGHNIFQGGFLGLDNIGVFDRSAPLPVAGHIDQADGTSWMAMYSLNMLRIALELATRNHVYEDIATKFFEHFLHIAEAMNNIGGGHHGLWDEQDQFFYDALHTDDGRVHPLRVRSMVGLIPLFAVEVIDDSLLQAEPEFARRLSWFLRYRPDLASLVSRWQDRGEQDRHLISLLRAHRMKAVLRRMLDPAEFLSPHGIRSLSRFHLEHPFTIDVHGAVHRAAYLPAESDSRLFGGNSNWRGPVWFPVNYLIVQSLRRFHSFYGDSFTVEHPTGSGKYATLGEVADDIARRLISIFLPGGDGRLPVYRHDEWLQRHAGGRGELLFYEYFDGDTGRGVGASHQTGWTALVAELIHELHAPRPGARSPS